MSRASEPMAVTLAGGGELPLVGFGTWRLRGRSAYQAVRHALDAGYRHLDTATMYANEQEVGRALRDSGLDRSDVFLTTKLWQSDVGREQRALEESLRMLGTDYIDLWLIHWPPGDQAGTTTWREFAAARDRGQARAIGVSNYDLDQIDQLTAETGQAPAVNQVPWSPARHDQDLLEEHRRRSVVLEGYSPLKGTRLRDPLLSEIAKRHGVDPAQVVLRWHLEHQIPVIPKSEQPARIVSNIDLFGFSLSDEEVARIDAL